MIRQYTTKIDIATSKHTGHHNITTNGIVRPRLVCSPLSVFSVSENNISPDKIKIVINIISLLFWFY